MGLFNLFKSSKKKKEEALLSNLTNQIFPGGLAHTEREAQEIREMLDFKYPLSEVFKAYIHTTIMYSQTREQNIVVNSVLRQEGCGFSKDDAIKIYNYVVGKKITTSVKSLIETARDTIKNSPDSEKIFSAAKGGLFVLQTNYKELNNYGKFEVILFNSLIALRAYGEKYPSKFDEVEKQYAIPLIRQAMDYNIMLSPERITSLINSRFEFYDREIEEIYTNKQYMASRLYSVFYIEPLVDHPKLTTEIMEIMKFYPALTTMFRWVHDNVKEKL